MMTRQTTMVRTAASRQNWKLSRPDDPAHPMIPKAVWSGDMYSVYARNVGGQPWMLEPEDLLDRMYSGIAKPYNDILPRWQ